MATQIRHKVSDFAVIACVIQNGRYPDGTYAKFFGAGVTDNLLHSSSLTGATDYLLTRVIEDETQRRQFMKAFSEEAYSYRPNQGAMTLDLDYYGPNGTPKTLVDVLNVYPSHMRILQHLKETQVREISVLSSGLNEVLGHFRQDRLVISLLPGYPDNYEDSKVLPVSTYDRFGNGYGFFRTPSQLLWDFKDGEFHQIVLDGFFGLQYVETFVKDVVPILKLTHMHMEDSPERVEEIHDHGDLYGFLEPLVHFCGPTLQYLSLKSIPESFGKNKVFNALDFSQITTCRMEKLTHFKITNHPSFFAAFVQAIVHLSPKLKIIECPIDYKDIVYSHPSFHDASARFVSNV